MNSEQIFWSNFVDMKIIMSNIHVLIQWKLSIARSLEPRNFVCYIRYFVISVVNKQYKTKEINSLGLQNLVCYISGILLYQISLYRAFTVAAGTCRCVNVMKFHLLVSFSCNCDLLLVIEFQYFLILYSIFYLSVSLFTLHFWDSSLIRVSVDFYQSLLEYYRILFPNLISLFWISILLSEYFFSIL